MDEADNGADAKPIITEKTAAPERFKKLTVHSIRYTPTIWAMLISKGRTIPDNPEINADMRIINDIISSFDTWVEYRFLKNGRVFKNTTYITPENTASVKRSVRDSIGLSDIIAPKNPQTRVKSPQYMAEVKGWGSRRVNSEIIQNKNVPRKYFSMSPPAESVPKSTTERYMYAEDLSVSAAKKGIIKGNPPKRFARESKNSIKDRGKSPNRGGLIRLLVVFLLVFSVSIFLTS